MSREDSNGEMFEIIDKKIEELSTADSISSMSSSASLLPSPGVSVSSVPSGGNILSVVQPPSTLPSFIAHPAISPASTASLSSTTILDPTSTTVPSFIQTSQNTPATSATNLNEIKNTAEVSSSSTDVFYPTQFSAAIPPSKGIKHGMDQVPIGNVSADNGGFMDWMRGAVSTGGILSKVAEKAKNSVDSMITTLDPQMREFIYSGGDCEILVASKQEAKISAIREAFQSVFGKATVQGIEAQSSNIAAQPVGFAAAVKAAEERIQTVLKNPKISAPLPVVAIENFILEVGEDKWYDLGVLILNDPIKQINLQIFTQMTPVPAEIVALAQEDTPADYPLRWSGLSVTIGSLMGSNLHVPNSEWHQALTGTSRRDIILQAANVLATLYKNSSSPI
ncbi:protein PRRC1-like [Atheta coriaria]|uniref:protein PRRC1-like n=1 Tax=Dalotia coriaria TaxID=877792 RepID=UPI0031F3F08A